jgi:hypothetical protein
MSDMSDMSDRGSQSSSSRSSDAGSKELPIVPFLMHKSSLNAEKGFGFFHLEMPLEGLSKTRSDEHPQIMLQIKDQDQMDGLMRMKKLQHQNILALHFFDENGVGDNRCVRAYVEPYTDYLPALFEDVEIFINKETEMVPSVPFQEIVRFVVTLVSIL